MKVAELSGDQLNHWVAKALGWVNYPNDSAERGEIYYTNPTKAPFGPYLRRSDWKPSSSWGQGGPLIEQERIGVNPTPDGRWVALSTIPFSIYQGGETPLVAAMRVIVFDKFGEEVPDND